MHDISSAEIIAHCISGVMTIVLSYAAYVMRRMLTSIEKLNIKIAVVVNELEHHNFRISQLESRRQ